MVDYEIAIRNSIKAVFPNIRVTGCRFHYGRAILKKIKAIGLQVECINIPVVRIWSCKFISICLLPANLIRSEVDKLKAKANHHSNVVVKEKMKKFIHCYERYWMLQKSPEMFSVHGLHHCTKNMSESLHLIIE